MVISLEINRFKYSKPIYYLWAIRNTLDNANAQIVKNVKPMMNTDNLISMEYNAEEELIEIIDYDALVSEINEITHNISVVAFFANLKYGTVDRDEYTRLNTLFSLVLKDSGMIDHRVRDRLHKKGMLVVDAYNEFFLSGSISTVGSNALQLYLWKYGVPMDELDY